MAKKQAKIPKDKLLAKLTTAFFDRPRMTALLWLAVIVFGIFSYTTYLRREGFPKVNVPLTIVNGTYFVNDPAKVDSDVAKPITDIAVKQPDVKTVGTQSGPNFFFISIQYGQDVDAKKASKALEQAVNKSAKIPASAQIKYDVPYFGPAGGLKPTDLAIAFYSTNPNETISDLVAKSKEAAKWLNNKKLSYVKDVFVDDPFQKVINPATGQQVTVQQSFDRFGKRENSQTSFYNSVQIGVTGVQNFDVLKLDKQVRGALDELNRQPQFKGYAAEVSASYAPSIKDSINELQRVLLEGLLAVLVIASVVIAIRASLITVVSMVTVLLATLALLNVIGYSLNVITLFALILALALIVDDTIIMVEAIDATRRTEKDARHAVQKATRKVSRAMMAATVTACLSFAPLLFVGGILGNFIQAIPITIISALIISLLLALIFIPFFARFVLLGKKHMGSRGVTEVAAGFEKSLAAFIARPMLWARYKKRRLFSIGIAAIFIGFAFFAGGILIAKDVVFNIFPPTKDSNGVVLQFNFPAGTSVEKAQAIAAKADKLAADTLGPYFVQSTYNNTGSDSSATKIIDIVSYTKRDVRAPELVKQLQQRLDKEFKDAKVTVGQSDVGPPSSSFIVQINAANRPAAFKAAEAVAGFMRSTELVRPSGKTARFVNVAVSNPGQYIRNKTKSVVNITAGFDGNDTSTLVTLAQNAVKKEFNEQKLRSLGLKPGDLDFDVGFESENQDSFKTLLLAFPVLLMVMYILLAIEFRSFLQPLLIFMAIPFSIFGIMFGLKVTNNAISFFSMLGFFALVGLSIKNTILLTDFANQARRSGMSAIDAAHAALEERFRPLFATSATAVVSLIPLAISSPFWQGLAVVLIFGLISNTILVITVFPYYYLGAEYLRLHISTQDFFIWLVLTALVMVGVTMATNIGAGLTVLPLSMILVSLQAFYKERLARSV
jgi:multidrug efflux pump subunit AcrB